MVLCASEPVTGDPRTQRRVAWGRLVTGEDVTAVLSHADQWPLLPHSHVELSSPVPARSAQEWFNALPDDTAKSIVNMRRSMLHVYKVQTTHFSKPAPQPTSTQVEQQQQPQQSVAGTMYLPTHGTDGEQPYAHYHTGQHLLGMVGQKQRTRFPPGVMPPPPGSDWPSYPMYPLPPPGHPMDVPPYSGMGLPMPGGGKHAYGRDGRPLFGPDGQPLFAGADSDLVDDGKGPAEPDTSERAWYSPDNLNPFTQFQYKWGRLDYSGQAVPTPEEQARAELAAQQPYAFGGVYPVGYHPAMVGPNGQLLQYPMAPYGVPGMPTGVPGLPPGSPGMPPPGAPPGTHGMPAPGSGGQHPLSQLRNPYMPQAMPQAAQHMPPTPQYYSSTPAQGATPTGSHTPQYQAAVSYGQQALTGTSPWNPGSAAQRPLFQSPAQTISSSNMQLASQQQTFPHSTSNLSSAPQQQALTPGQQLMQQALLNLQTQQQQQQQQQLQQQNGPANPAASGDGVDGVGNGGGSGGGAAAGWQDTLLAELEGEALEEPLWWDGGDIGGTDTPQQEEQSRQQPEPQDGRSLDELRELLRSRVEACEEAADNAVAAAADARTREMVAMSSPVMRQLSRLKADLRNAQRRFAREQEEAYGQVQ